MPPAPARFRNAVGYWLIALGSWLWAPGFIASSHWPAASAMSGIADEQASPEHARAVLAQQIYTCFNQKQHAKALELIRTYLEKHPADADMIYNLACAHCVLGDFDSAAQALHRAFKAGFRDLEHMRHDPDLAALREHSTFKKILEEADRVAVERAKTAVDHWRETYGSENYRYETDEKHRLNYATALDEISHNEMRQMLALQADQMIKSLFGQPPSYYVLIAVPLPNDADTFFKNNDSIGGMYEHRPRRLVARDIGSSLRHEFFHAYHFGHMERLGQQHPLWLQEGLASLYEDYEFTADGSIRFLPNERQGIVKTQARAGRLSPWGELFNMPANEFMRQSPRLYPQVRSIFEYVADKGKLEDWYKAYVEGFERDRSGAKAFEKAFELPLASIEKNWRMWVHQQPEFNFRIRVGDASLGIRTRDNASNDGVLVTDVLMNSAAQLARLKRGDVIVSIDGKSTRTLVDLRRVLAERQVGDEVEVKARRNGEYFTAKVQLRPLVAGY